MQDPNVRVIINARNFGPLRNTYHGVMQSSGNAVLLFLPADLQDPPELLPKFVSLWEQGYDFVYGIRSRREEAWPMRRLRDLYYRILMRLSGTRVLPGVGDFQLADRRVVESMRNVRDNRPFMRMMTFECSDSGIGVPYTWRSRKKGHSKNRISALIDQGLNGFISFTTAPIRLCLLSGFAISTVSIFLALMNLVIGLIWYRQISEPGIMTLIVAIFFLGGVQLFFTGLIGEYVLAIYGQVRERPLVFERERINFDAVAPAEEASATKSPQSTLGTAHSKDNAVDS